MAADTMDGIQVFCRSYYHIPDPRQSTIEIIFTNCGDRDVELGDMYGLGFSQHAYPHPLIPEPGMTGPDGKELRVRGPSTFGYVEEGAWEWVYGGPKLAAGEFGILRGRGRFSGKVVPSMWTVGGRYAVKHEGETLYEEAFEFSMSFPGFRYHKDDVPMIGPRP